MVWPIIRENALALRSHLTDVAVSSQRIARVLLPVRGAHRRFADTRQNFFCGWYISERLADMAPSLAAIDVHEQSCVQGDVLSVHAGTAVH